MQNVAMWIFGYGSLIWKTGFEFETSSPGYVQGWKRRFWQGSPDHRGTEDRLGRVVTLISEPSAKTWGVAYKLPSARAESILEALDYREKGGYSREWVPVLDAENRTITENALVYHATPENPYFLGDDSPEAIARHIKSASGPSGSNVDYLESLDAALKKLGVQDPHIASIMSALETL